MRNLTRQLVHLRLPYHQTRKAENMSRFTASGGFIYAGPYKKRERAESVLEDMYATGDALPGEGIHIEAVKDHRSRVVGYAIVQPY